MDDTDIANLGNKFFSLEKFNEAISCYTIALVSTKATVKKICSRPRAQAHIRCFQVKKPMEATYYAMRGYCSLRMKNLEEAVSDLEIAAYTDSYNSTYWIDLSEALVEMRNYDNAKYGKNIYGAQQ